MSVFFLFLLALAAGTLSTLFWIPEDELGGGYFRINALVVLVLLAVAAAAPLVAEGLSPFGGSPAGRATFAVGLAGAFLYYAAAWRERWRPGRIALAVGLAGSTAALVLAGTRLLASPAPLPARPALLVASLLTAALLLGWSLITMLLGHWYLVMPRLRFRHLTVFCAVLLATVAARSLVAGVGLAAGLAAPDPGPVRLLLGFDGQGMFFWFRVLWGLAIPALLAWMALQCARTRSNQSATGILYVLLVGTLIGEITALYLTLTTGVPL